MAAGQDEGEPLPVQDAPQPLGLPGGPGPAHLARHHAWRACGVAETELQQLFSALQVAKGDQVVILI